MNKKYVIDENLYIEKYLIKGSKFICYLQYIEKKEEAQKFINNYKHNNFSHNCYAYIIENKKIIKFFDDGEPVGTAGKAICDLLILLNVTNIVVLVARKFGGTLLGKNGLIKAYKHGPLTILSKIIKYQLISCYEYEIALNIKNQKIILNFLHQNNIKIINQIFKNDIITITIVITDAIIIEPLIKQNLINNHKILKSFTIKK